MSARPDIRHVPGGSSGPPGPPGAAPAHNQSYYSRHPQINARHDPNYLVNASKTMRSPAAHPGVPVTLTGGLTLGRSSSPAGTSRAPTSYPPPSGLAQRVLAPADHANPVRYVPSFPPNSGSPFSANIRDVAAFMRGNADRHGDRGLSVPTSAPPPPSSAQRTLISNRHPQQLYNSESYLRDVAAHMASTGILPNSFPPSTVAASSAHSAAAAIAAAASAETVHKSPRLDLAPHPSGSGAAGSSSAAISRPLTIDTREAVKESCYQPPVEAISPTGPEAPGDHTDDLKAVKDDLLLKITKVDREIAKTESQIAKLKKKYQEQEEHANKPLSDSNEEVEDKPKNQSIAQIIYNENRLKAKSSHSMLDKYAVNELPLYKELPSYNQPSDTDVYHKTKSNHAVFKKVLIEHFRKKAEEKDARERYLTDTYAKLSAAWNKKVERVENSRKRKDRDAKSRELYEKIFPELRKQREDKERDHRLGTRGAVRSEADIEDVIERLQEQEMEDKKMHSLAVIPPMLLPPEERKRKFINNNGLILDPLKEYNERKFFNTWTEQEKEIFKEKFLLHPKNFGIIAQSLERKNVADCVQYYYLSKKTENYKQVIRKSKLGRRGRRAPNTAAAQAEAARAALAAQDANIIGATSSGVLTRNRNKNENENSRDGFDGSNRSTPQPGIKQEPKDEKDDDDKKGKSKSNDSSDDDEAPQSVKSGPHQCNVCKSTVESSRPVSTKNLAFLLNLSESDIGSETRVCNPCFMKAQRKKGNSNCPIPVCTSTKGRMKGRLRHMPSKLKDLPKEARETINNEFHLTDHIKFRKCCSACFTRLTRRIAQLTDGSSAPNKTETEPQSSILWSEDEIETLKNCLKNSGRNWAVISQKLNGAKTPEQCKKFFYNNRKKQQLDKLVAEYKRSTQSGDQPPTLSSDEESGSSTSSCEESAALQNNATPSASNSPVPRPRPNSDANNSKTAPPQTASSSNTEIIKPKEEIKTEATTATNNSTKPEPMDTTSAPPNPPVVPKKEEEYDSSATMSADERESEPRAAASIYPNMPQAQVGQGYGLTQGIGRETSIKPIYPNAMPSNMIRPGMAAPPAGTMVRPGLTQVRPMGAPVAMVPNAANPQTVVLPDGVAKDTITVKELMINVIEKSLQTPNQNPMAQPGITHVPGNQPPPSPTIQTILDGSSKPQNKPNYVRDRIGLNPRGGAPPGSMAPPAGPPPSQQQAQAAAAAAAAAAASQSNDCETLDLSMPRRRESAATPPNFQRDPLPHRKSPSFASMSSSGDTRPQQPPPAHANKVKSEYLRDISPSSYDGRPLATPPHGLGGTSPSPGPPRPPSSSSRGILPPTTQPYMGRSPMAQPTVTGRQPALSPKVASKPPLTIQTGSITQGTPVQQGTQQRYGEPLLKMTPPDARAVGGGSITQGTPVYDKTARRIQETQFAYAAQAAAAAGNRDAASVLAAARYPDQHLTSRQVIMNDFAMARSNEMQRRPDSRDAHGRSISPSTSRGSLRDLSPRPRTLDPRSAQLTGGRPTSTDPRLDPRYIAAAAVAEQQHRSIAGLPEPRGDPKADLPSHHKDPRGLQRAQPASTLSRNFFLGASTTVSAPTSQQVFLSSDGRYSARSRSPPRSTPPPPTSRQGISQISQQRQGGITSGKPIVSNKELYRGPPEVTISKTSSPRGSIGYSEVANNPLTSLVDVAVQQPKIDLSQALRQHALQAMMAQVAHPKVSAASLAPSASQLNQLVQNERAKQQFYLIDAAQAATAAAQAGGYSSSAARITASTKTPHASSSGGVSRGDAPAVIISERQQQQQLVNDMMKRSYGMTAQGVIDQIITQSIAGGQTSEELKASLAKVAQESEAASRARQQPPTSAHESQSSSHKPTLPPDMVLNRELSITPASNVSVTSAASLAEDFMKKRQILITTTATLTPTSSAPSSRVSDERQITRVAQSVSPAVNKPSLASSDVASNSGLSMTNSGSSVAAISAPSSAAIPSSVSLDLKPRSSEVMRPPSVSEASPKPPMNIAPPNGEQNPPGMFSLDYVKNKIMEEMKKHGEDDGPLPGQKRASPDGASGPGGPPDDAKKAKVDGGSSEAANNSNANNPPDSPGSPGEMVIDERPEDGSKAVGASNDQNNSTNNTSVSSEASKANPTTVTTASSNATGTPTSSGSSAAPGSTPAGQSSSKYEPLSDDE